MGNSIRTIKLRRELVMISALIIIIALVTTGIFINKRFKIISSDVASPKSDVASLKSDVASLKSDVASLMSDVDLLRSSILAAKHHIEVRKFIIYSQARQLQQKNFALIVGDSITEGLYFKNFSGYEVLNGGIGGGRLATIQQLLRDFPDDKKMSSIILAIGVNDARRAEVKSTTFFSNWESTYRTVIAKAKGLSPNVLVSTIIPVEANKQLGDKFFDPNTIDKLNSIIRKVANEENISLIDNDPAFIKLSRDGVTFTVDGVHLNDLGYKTWKANILSQQKNK